MWRGDAIDFILGVCEFCGGWLSVAGNGINFMFGFCFICWLEWEVAYKKNLIIVSGWAKAGPKNQVLYRPSHTTNVFAQSLIYSCKQKWKGHWTFCSIYPIFLKKKIIVSSPSKSRKSHQGLIFVCRSFSSQRFQSNMEGNICLRHLITCNFLQNKLIGQN